MQARRDDLKDSFYLYIMRNSIGAGLRNQYEPNGHMPDRLAELLREIDIGKHGARDSAGDGNEERPPSMRKPARKQ
jgi:hypothetical protein